MSFAKQPRHGNSGRVPKFLISSQTHQTRVSHLQSSTQVSLAHACACMAANVNICGSYLSRGSLWRFMSGALLLLQLRRSVWRPQEQELLHGPCRDTASSLRDYCDIWTHRISLPFPHFDLRPSWLESRLVIPSTQGLFFSPATLCSASLWDEPNSHKKIW